MDPPSSREVASFFISREINNLKDEMRSMKSDIAFLLRKSNEATDVSLANNMVGKELLSIKRELSCLREAMSINCTSTVEVEVPDVLAAQKHSKTIHTTHNQLVITSWNCRGYKNALPYINHLLESGSDVIALSEHWMWPFEIPELCHIHPDYTGFGRADKRLHDQSTLSRGCGGVGLLWKKSIQTSLIEIDSDRICGIQIELEDCLLSVLSVYLPCSGQNLEEFSGYVKELQSIVCALQSCGPVMLAGDFNAHLPNYCSTPNEQGHILSEFIDQNQLYPVISCRTIGHHPLNLSDHLPITISMNSTKVQNPRRNS